MAEPRHALVLNTPQHIQHMPGAKALAGAIDTGEQLLRGLGGVPGSGRGQAGVTIATGGRGPLPVGVRHRGHFLAKIGEQGLPAAAGRLAPAKQRVQPLPLVAFVARLGIGTRQHLRALHHIIQAIHQPGLGRLIVAPGAAGLLIVRLHAAGQVQMSDKAHIGLVDAHAKGHGRHHDNAVLAQETRLVTGAQAGLQARVVGQRREALCREPGGGGLDLPARQAIDDAAFFPVGGQEAQQLFFGILPGRHAVADIGPVKAAHKHLGLPEREAGGNISAGLHGGGGGQGHARHGRKGRRQLVQKQVVLAEIMPPLGNAVGLVNRDQRQRKAAQPGQRCRLH